MASERHQLSHLRADARWCEFREVATNRIPGSHTIRVYECACGIPLRMVDPDEPMPRSESRAESPAASEVRERS